MKFLLTLVICSGLEGVGCIPPHVWPDKFDNLYDCLMQGYDESTAKLTEIGKDSVNDNLIHIKFYCTPLLEEKPGTQT